MEQKGENINTDYAVTGWMLCVIPHIGGDIFNNAQNHHHIQVNTVINIFLELHETLDTFLSKYTNFSHNNDLFEINEFIWNSKYISDVNSNIWHQKYSLPSTKFLVFVACRVTSKILGIGYAERSWGDVKIIKSEKISALGSDIYENQSIVYTSACIE